MVTFGGNNALYSRSEALAELHFFINSHALFTEALNACMLLWYVLQAFSTMCLHKLKSKPQRYLLSVSTRSSNWRHLLPFDTTSASIMIEAGCLDVDPLRCSETSFPNFTTHDDSGHSITECLSSDVSEPSALNRGFLEHLILFPLVFFSILDTVKTEIFFFVPVLSFSGMVRVFEGLFEDILAYNPRSY